MNTIDYRASGNAISDLFSLYEYAEYRSQNEGAFLKKGETYQLRVTLSREHGVSVAVAYDDASLCPITTCIYDSIADLLEYWSFSKC